MRVLGSLLLLLSVGLIGYSVYRITNKSDTELQQRTTVTLPVSVPAPRDEDTGTREDISRNVPPPDSGIRLHALELRGRPRDSARSMITLEAWSFPTPAGMGRFHYESLPYEQAIQARAVGLLFNRTVDANVCIFDMMLNDPNGDFMQGTDVEVAGELAVETSEPRVCPNNHQLWDVEPEGSYMGTSQTGVMLAIPKVRFWRYHDTK